ncbi:MAG: ZmpA/ZmpB/ZmpC family metallo-endopeptidase-related protein, partial [Planctomycetota bacterium]
MQKIRRILTLAAVLVVFGFCGSALAFSGAGSGTESDPYVITTVEQLQEMNDDLDAYYVLGNDIDASATQTWNYGKGFVPVGTYTGDPDDAFTGDFDGRGHSINELYINRITSNWQGLFGNVRNASVKDVVLSNVEVTANLKSGTLAGEVSVYSTITNCSATGTLTLKAGTGDSKSGGLVGFVYTGSHVSECSSAVNVTASDRKQVGGLIGVVEGRSYYTLLTNSYSTGTVTGGGSKQGNLVGDADGCKIDRCYSCGYGKALIGFNWQSPVITNSYWDRDKGAWSSSYGGTPKTTAQMMQQATFVNWDFVSIWGIVENETYPFLLAFEDRELTTLRIIGPNEVAENFRASYKAVAHYDNNSTRDVTSLAEWQIRPESP